jgi:hypothetical protein
MICYRFAERLVAKIDGLAILNGCESLICFTSQSKLTLMNTRLITNSGITLKPFNTEYFYTGRSI